MSAPERDPLEREADALIAAWTREAEWQRPWWSIPVVVLTYGLLVAGLICGHVFIIQSEEPAPLVLAAIICLILALDGVAGMSLWMMRDFDRRTELYLRTLEYADARTRG